MRLFQSEMLHSADAAPAPSYRRPAYGSRYDRRARRAPIPALSLESLPEPTGVAQASPRDILFRIAEFDRAA